MAKQDQARHQTPQNSSSAPLILGSLAIIAVAYVGFIRPAQLHMQSLERQCNKLVIAVKKLQTKDESARQGLRLISLLDAQDDKLASAERALISLTTLNERLVHEAESLAESTAALQQLEQVRSDVDRYSETLTTAATTLNEMSDVSASITASSHIAREANGSLVNMSAVQSELTRSVTRLSRQLTGLENQLATQSTELPQAELALQQIEQLCEDLMTETANISTAQQQLGLLVGLKQKVLAQADSLPAAEATLDQIWDLNDGLLQAKQTFDKAQQLTVDMLLLEPVIDRIAETLQPAAEATRLSKRSAARAPKTRQTANSTGNSPWSSALNVFVALLTPAS